MKLLKAVARVLPQQIKDAFVPWRKRRLVAEISKLSIQSTGIDAAGYPWVQLASGRRFIGFLPDSRQQRTYKILAREIPNVPESCYAVVTDIISRYLAPRSIPGSLAGVRDPYMPLRDPLRDFAFDITSAREMADRFLPRPGETFVDIGAYQGFGTMRIAELVGPDGQVIAFEADPKVRDVLERNIAANDFRNVKIVPCAVGSEPGKMTFYHSAGTVNSLDKSVLSDLGYDDLSAIEVDVDTVDAVLSRMGVQHVDKWNITVNGGEIGAVQGMSEILVRPGAMTITLAGWYMKDGQRICDAVEPDLVKFGFEIRKGKLGRLLAWR